MGYWADDMFDEAIKDTCDICKKIYCNCYDECESDDVY